MENFKLTPEEWAALEQEEEQRNKVAEAFAKNQGLQKLFEPQPEDDETPE
jgi:hypothetical protein